MSQQGPSVKGGQSQGHSGSLARQPLAGIDRHWQACQLKFDPSMIFNECVAMHAFMRPWCFWILLDDPRRDELAHGYGYGMIWVLVCIGNYMDLYGYTIVFHFGSRCLNQQPHIIAT